MVLASAPRGGAEEDGVDVAAQRLRNSRLFGSRLTRVDEVVRWHGAMQAQDHPGASWAVAQRAPGLTEPDVARAFDAGEVVRTHALRPTWHLLAAEDLRWVQRLTASRVHAVNRSRYDQLGLDAVTRQRGAEAVRGGRHLTRAELGAAIVDAGIDVAGHAEPGQRLAYLVMHAELEQVLCSGPMRGKQHTYARVDERVPPAPDRSSDEDLVALVTRYFQARGPATAYDLSWWSGSTVTESRRAIELAEVPRAGADARGRPAYGFAPLEVTTVARGPLVHLLPNFDELFIGFRDRSAMFDPEVLEATPAGRLETNVVTLDGRAIGGWRRTLGAATVTVEVQLAADLDLLQRAALTVAAERYATYLGRTLDLHVVR
jgi:hypothetical protein